VSRFDSADEVSRTSESRARPLTLLTPSAWTHTSVGAGGNKAGPSTTTGISAAKLENETEDFHIEKVSSNLKQQIIQARTAKKMTQVQLAQAINEKPQVIQDYESGKAIPNPQHLSKMSRILGVVLKKGA
jgi:putative transcription factor